MTIISVWESDGNDRWLEGVYETGFELWEFVDSFRENIDLEFDEEGDEEVAILSAYSPCECGEENCEEEGHEGGAYHLEFIIGTPAQPHTIRVW
jgi:hypothetical protein